MRILVIQFAPDNRGRPVPRFDPQLGTLLALLRRRDHELALLGLARTDLDTTKAALARHLPQLIYADISGVCVDAARRTLEYIRQHEFLPVVVGGNYPSVDPADSLSLPGVQAAVIGEPDASLVTYLERRQDPVAGQVVLGVWLRDEQGLARPDLPHLVEELNSLPFPERDLFDHPVPAGNSAALHTEHIRKTARIEIAVGRGCPQRCAYCVNDRLASIYAGRGTWVRRRSPENVLAEINLLRQRQPPLRALRFRDHAFALDHDWLCRFLQLYRQRCGLPFRCHLRLNAAQPETIAQLAAAGCELVDVELISGSDFIRNEIFDMDLTGDQIAEAFAHLRAAPLRTRVVVYLGAPYESEASLEETEALLRRVCPDLLDARPYYPWPGTRARELAREHGWLHVGGEEQYHQDRPGLHMPACRPDLVQAFVRRLRLQWPAATGAAGWRRWSQLWRQVFGQIFGRRG